MSQPEETIAQWIKGRLHSKAAPHHPKPDDLWAYHRRELSERQAARVRSHLVACPPCTQAVLDMDRFPDLEEGEQMSPSQQEAAADWKAVQDRVRTGRSDLRTSRFWVYAAAALLLLSLGLSLWAVHLKRQLGLFQPQVNVFVQNLRPLSAAGPTRTEDAESVSFPSAMDGLVLILNLSDLREFPDFEAEFIQGGKLIWKRNGLVRGPEGNFTFQIPKKLLTEGDHQIRLYGLGDSGRTLLTTYGLHLQFE